MTAVAEFEHVYPGLFGGGSIGWRYFWVLYARIPTIRARERRETMYAHLYGGLLQSEKGQEIARRMMEETQAEAAGGVAAGPAPVDEWEALTAEGRRRLNPGRES